MRKRKVISYKSNPVKSVTTKPIEEKIIVQEEEKPMSLSIIIPCHDLENYITPCLNSLLEQTNVLKVNREIIFICDKCTDRTHEMIENAMKDSSWKYSITDVAVGSPGEARNKGLELAKGKYIWFVDGDDWLTTPNAVDIVLECMLRDDMDIVEFKIKSVANPNGVFGSGTVWRAMLSRRIIGDTKFNNRQNGEDNDFSWAIWHKEGAKYGKIAAAPYFYNYPRKGSQSDIAYNTAKNL